MIFESSEDIYTIVTEDDIAEEEIQDHFMRYGDEVFYVVNDGILAGVITPGDLYRFRFRGGSLINRTFSYIENRYDVERARGLMEAIKTVHELPVIEDGRFVGVLRSGNRKSEAEWKRIRESFYIDEKLLEAEKEKWIIEDIRKLLSIGCKYFVYRRLNLEDMDLTYDLYESVLEKERNYPDSESLRCLTQREQIELFGKADNEEFIINHNWFGRNRKIFYRDGIPKYEDVRNAVYNIVDGKRIVPNRIASEKGNGGVRRIFVVGPCTMFGGLSYDSQTIEAYLQEILYTDGFDNYEVINLSITGDMSWIQLYREPISKDDIVILMSYRFEYWRSVEKDHEGQLSCLDSMRCVWDELDHPQDHIYNLPDHCDSYVNKRIAGLIYRDIRNVLFDNDKKMIFRKTLQNYYISWDIYEYYRKYYAEIAWKMKTSPESGTQMSSRDYGCIVANGNPFTMGHRFLIENAAKEVEHLFVLILETERSKYTFPERLKMAIKGTEDINNVTILPGGKYVISQDTFSQYFEKDQVEDVRDMSYDLHIFGRVVAKILGVSKRYVGEEPFDKVTREYNKTMKRILPQYGIEVIEMKRMMDVSDKPISASEVRRKIEKNEDWKELVPYSTMELLRLENEGI